MTASVLEFDTCFMELSENQLVVRNECFMRTWRVGIDGVLRAESFLDLRAGREWLANSSEQPAPTPLSELASETRVLALHKAAAPSAVEAPSLTAELTATGPTSTLVYTFQVFPGAGGVRIWLHATGTEANTLSVTVSSDDEPTGIEQDLLPSAPVQAPPVGRDTLEAFSLAPLHLKLTQATFADQTDHHNELVSEQEWLLHPSENALSLPGCLFYVHDVLTESGLIFLKEAPLPHARPVSSPHDLYVQPAARRFTFLGHGADEDGANGYAFVTLAYAGGKAGRIATLQQYYRCLRPYVPTRDGMLVSNTWGDRNRDGRINADFMAQEIEAGARLGVDVIQIDDGWQVGATSNSVRAQAEGGVWEGFYAKKDNFWNVNPERFPEGLSPLVTSAQEKGLRFGLWFGPDSAVDFANWKRDADQILRLHRELNIQYIKIDGVKLRSKVGEHNLHAFFDYVLTESEGNVVFDLDVTAEVRPGYFSLVRGGPLFVENRYTDWHKYWPHQTLRNLWKLAQHVDPVRLRMEWLNHDRNLEKYANDPLAPLAYRPDYLFATVMFGSPLGWFEISSLPTPYFDEAAPLIAVWKAHREAIFSGTILPLGSAPDGVSWTGFASVAPDNRSAYLLVFREGAQRADWQSPILSLIAAPSASVSLERLGGDGAAELRDGDLHVTIPESHRFFFGRVTL